MNSPNPGRPEPPREVRVDMSSTAPVTCDECEGDVFAERFLLRRVSPIASPNGRPAVVPVPVFACAACGHVDDDMRPT